MATPNRPYLVVRTIVRWSPLLLFLWLIAENIVPFGSSTMKCTARACDPRIHNFAGRETSVTTQTEKKTGNQYRVITANPLTFEANLFRPMKRAAVTMVYQNPGNWSNLRFGVLGRNRIYEYASMPVISPLLIGLLDTWDVQRSGDLVLFTRPERHVKRIEGVDRFLATTGVESRTGMLNVSSDVALPIPYYVASAEVRRIPVSIRGSHAINVYVGRDEPLNVSLRFQDINRHSGRDDVTIRVSRGFDIVKLLTVKDDGNASANGKASAEQTVDVRLPNTSEGVYRIEVTTKDDDPFIREVVTSQRLMMFDRALYLAGSSEYRALGMINDQSTTVYYRGTELRARTSHANALQSLTVGGKKLTIDKVNKTVLLKLGATPKVVPITVRIQDVTLEGDGTFAFSPEAFFETRSYHVVSGQSDLPDLNYVIARVPSYTMRGEDFVTDAALDLPNQRRVQFVITGDSAAGKAGRDLLLRELTVKIEGDPLTPRTFYRLVREVIQRIRAGAPA